jgi:drug/metabolite transporter (DMT)-like permease
VISEKRQSLQDTPSLRTILLTAITMAFFAANSLLARLALRSGEIDAGAFTAVRIVAGAGALATVTSFRRKEAGAARRHGSLRSALALFTYAIAFSFAYLSLNAGTGALVLFAAVQLTMVGLGIANGERLRLSEWTGLAVAFAGLVYLVSPGLTAPSPAGVLLMTVSGVAWGYYSTAARDVSAPIAATAGNFAGAIPPAVGALLVTWGIGQSHASWSGIGLATLCGAVTSGLGYAIWYVALRALRMGFAAIVQLTVPALAAAAGVIWLGEPLTGRPLLASAAILGGVALALLGKGRAVRQSPRGPR